MKIKAIPIILAIMTVLLSGCGTIFRFDNDGHYSVYPGTQTDFQLIETWSKGTGTFEAEPVFVLLSTIDIPISLVTDTCLLPVDTYFIFTKNEKNDSNQQVDPTVKTPVESGNEQGTAGHP
jgi:uncharacterized protein YceK